VQGSHGFRADGAMFDEENLVSHAGLVPVLELAEQAGLSQLLDEHVRVVDERVKSGAANRHRSGPRSSRGWPPARTASTTSTSSAPVG
jgi:hypothetical protein